MRRTALGEVVELRAGVGFPRKLQGRISGHYPMAKVGDISRAGRSLCEVLHSADNYVDEADLNILKAKPVPAGSVLFAKIGEAIRHNHRVVAGRPLLIDNNAMAAIPRSGEIDPRYLFRFLQTVDLYALVTSTTVPALRKADLERIQVPLPPLAEQRRIAATLDGAAEVRARRRAIVAHLDALAGALFHEMFGDAAVNQHGLPLVPFLSAVENVSRLAPKIPRSKFGQEGRFPVVDQGASAIAGFVDDRSLVYPGSLPVVLFGDHTRTFKFVDEPFVVGADGVKVLAPREEFDALYLFHALRALNIPDAGYSRHFKFLSERYILAPPREQQAEFATRVRLIEAQRRSYERLLIADDELLQSLRAGAFRGDL